MKYYVDYHTGAGNQVVEGTLDDAVRAVGNNLAYTQKDITITDEDRKTVAMLTWYGVVPSEDDIVTCDFGDLGFYGEWWYL